PLGLYEHTFDSFHQTASKIDIEEPVLNLKLAGCPDCVHIHWRWGTAASKIGQFLKRGSFGQGQAIGVPENSLQSVQIAVTLYKANEVHSSWDQVHNVESIREFHDPRDVVFWYIGTGFSPKHDEFFNHGGFFNPNYGSWIERFVSPSNLTFGNPNATSGD